MNSHIAITADDGTGKQRPLVLPADFSLDIDDQNPLFNDNEMFSYPCRMPLEGNRFFLGNIDDPLNVDRPVSLEHRKMRISVDNQPFRSGTLVTAEDEEIDGALTMNISASEHSIDDLIGDLECQKVPLKDKILIGEKIGAVTAKAEYDYHVKITFDGKKPDHEESGTNTETSNVEYSPQALGFSYPAECETTGTKDVAVLKETLSYANGHKRVVPKVKASYINVSDPYPTAKYCNARICYTHYGLQNDGKETGSKVDEKEISSGPELHFPYWVLDANRPQSGICFYVLYFLDCLFNYLGVSFDHRELLKVEDMKHLCFFTTHCKYTEERKYADRTSPDFDNIDDINNWLNSRGCGAHFEFKDEGDMSIDKIEYTENGVTKTAVVGNDGVTSIVAKHSKPTYSVQANIMRMYATSENFPDESVQTVLDALQNSFGIRFEYDYEKKHVRAYFIRDVFRNTEAPIDFPGEVISMHKVAEKITGVRMCYSKESTSKEQQDNVRTGKKDYDTSYDYIDYPQASTVTNLTYKDIMRKPLQTDANGNRCTYIDKQTGNAYRIKINSSAETVADYKPSLFEVGQWKGVEIGDCSTINEDYVKEFSSDFVPVEFNDVNYRQEVGTAEGSVSSNGYSVRLSSSAQPLMVAYTNEKMEHEFLEQRISQAMSSTVAKITFDEVLDSLMENYNPQDGDDNGNSPLQKIDWGLSIAIMRGGGTDSTVQQYDFDYDGFGNSKWRTVSGQYALSADSLDLFGSEYDYNGVKEGIGDGERFSLKIRSWKQPSWSDKPICNPDELDSKGNVTKKIMSRGLFDTFMSELANFYLKRRKYIVTLRCSSAQIADVPNHWTRRYRINGMTGWINKLSYSVTVADGIGEVQVEFFVI